MPQLNPADFPDKKAPATNKPKGGTTTTFSFDPAQLDPNDFPDKVGKPATKLWEPTIKRESTWPETIAAGAMRTAPAVGLGMLGGPSIVGNIALGGLGAAIGEGLAQTYEINKGIRTEYSLSEGTIQALAGAVPLIGKFPGASAPLKQLMAYVARNAGQGGLVNAASTFPMHVAQSGKMELPSFGELAGSTAVGTVVGGGMGAAVAGAARYRAPSQPTGLGRIDVKPDPYPRPTPVSPFKPVQQQVPQVEGPGIQMNLPDMGVGMQQPQLPFPPRGVGNAQRITGPEPYGPYSEPTQGDLFEPTKQPQLDFGASNPNMWDEANSIPVEQYTPEMRSNLAQYGVEEIGERNGRVYFSRSSDLGLGGLRTQTPEVRDVLPPNEPYGPYGPQQGELDLGSPDPLVQGGQLELPQAPMQNVPASTGNLPIRRGFRPPVGPPIQQPPIQQPPAPQQMSPVVPPTAPQQASVQQAPVPQQTRVASATVTQADGFPDIIELPVFTRELRDFYERAGFEMWTMGKNGPRMIRKGTTPPVEAPPAPTAQRAMRGAVPEGAQTVTPGMQISLNQSDPDFVRKSTNLAEAGWKIVETKPDGTAVFQAPSDRGGSDFGAIIPPGGKIQGPAFAPDDMGGSGGGGYKRPTWNERPPRQDLHGTEEIPELAFQPDEGVISKRENWEEAMPGTPGDPITREFINEQTETDPAKWMNYIVEFHPDYSGRALSIYSETDPQKIVDNLRRIRAEYQQTKIQWNEAATNQSRHNIPIPEEVREAHSGIGKLKDLAESKYERASTRQLGGGYEGGTGGDYSDPPNIPGRLYAPTDELGPRGGGGNTGPFGQDPTSGPRIGEPTGRVAPFEPKGLRDSLSSDDLLQALNSPSIPSDVRVQIENILRSRGVMPNPENAPPIGGPLHQGWDWNNRPPSEEMTIQDAIERQHYDDLADLNSSKNPEEAMEQLRYWTDQEATATTENHGAEAVDYARYMVELANERFHALNDARIAGTPEPVKPQQSVRDRAWEREKEFGPESSGPRGMADPRLDISNPLEGQLELPWSRGINELRQRNGLDSIANQRAQQLLTENWGETGQPQQTSMEGSMKDAEISNYLNQEDATPPEMRDLGGWGSEKGSAPMIANEAERVSEKLKGWGWGQGSKKHTAQGETGNAYVDEVLGLSKAATTIGDYSYTLKHALPMIFSPHHRAALIRSIKGGWDENIANAIYAELEQLPLFQKSFNPNTMEFNKSVAEQAGLDLKHWAGKLNKRTEQNGSNWLENGQFFGIPESAATRAYANSWGRMVRGSNRAFTTMRNYIMAHQTQGLFDAGRNMAIEAHNTGSTKVGMFDTLTGNRRLVSPEEAVNLNPYENLDLAKDIVDFMKTALGEAPLKGHILPHRAAELNVEHMAKGLTRIFFAPRLVASRMRMLNPSTYIMAPPFVRKQYMKAAMSSAIFWFGLAKAAEMSGAAEVSWDPDSADFGVMRFGNRRLDFSGGFKPFLVAMHRFWLSGGYTSSADNQWHRYGEGYQAQTQLDQLQRVAANKLEPLTKFAYDLLNASEHQKFHVYDRTAQLFLSLTAQDAYEILTGDDPKHIGLMLPIMFGAGTQMYTQGETPSRLVPEEYDWTITGGGMLDRAKEVGQGISNFFD